MSLRELYQEMILDHGKQPRNFGKLENHTHLHAGHNPLCGDKLLVFLDVRNGIVEDLKFNGEGCAISMASASIMTETVKGKTLSEVEALFGGFHQLVTTGEEQTDMPAKMAIFAGVAEFPARVKCASLAWHTLNAALQNQNDPASTE